MTHDYRVRSSAIEYSAFKFEMVRDSVAMPDDGVADRIYLRHPGAVAVVAIDEDDRVALVNQYRHPVREHLWELPAGLRDVEGEPAAETAARELVEETDMRAGTIEPLIELYSSPGCSDEWIPVFLAGQLSPVPDSERHVRTDEEAEMETRWWPLEDAVAGILSSKIRNGIAIAGILAAVAKRNR